MEHESFISFYKFPVTARLERYIDALRERDEFSKDECEYDKDRYFTKMRNDIDNVIEANDKLLAHLYAAKRSYAKADGEIRTIQASRRGGFGF